MPVAGLPAAAGLDVGLFLVSDRFPDIFSCGAGFLFSRDVVKGWLELGSFFPFGGLSDAEVISGDGLFLSGEGLLSEPGRLGLLCLVVGRTCTPCPISFCPPCSSPAGIGVLVVSP